jgi:tetratricopeptide (TPR) repeat protein
MPDEVNVNQGGVQIGRESAIAAGRDIVFRDKTETHTHIHIPDSLELTGSRLAPRNPLFVGREKLLTDLAGRLNAEGGLTLLTGYGGLGKTQTAIEFGHRYRDRFPGGVFFLNCAHADLISGEVAACGDEGRLPIPNYGLLPQPDQVNLVLREWHKPIIHLIIMDNAEDPALVNQWRRLAGGGCRYLVTARRDSWPPALAPNVVHLRPLDRPDSVKLLGQNSQTFANDPAADRIADLLGDHPLALHCAASYLAHYALSPADYLRELQSQVSSLQHESLGDWLQDELPTAHTPNVTATFELSYQSLISNSLVSNSPLLTLPGIGGLEIRELAKRAFHLLAHCAPAVPLPREVLLRALNGTSALSGGRSEAKPEVEGRGAGTTQRGADTTQPIPDVSDKQLTDALRALSNVGLIELDSQLRPATHRLLQEFARLKADDSNADAAKMEDAVGEMASEINEAGLPKALEPLREHLRALAERAEARGSENAGRLFNSLGYHLNAIADYAAARAAYERALTISEKVLGADHPNVATLVNNLGSVLQDLGDLPAARAAYERALAIDEKTFGPDHPNVARDVNNLGLVHQALGDLPAARAAYERALTVGEKAFGPDHPNVATDVNNLGSVLQALGDLPAARAAYERALAIDEKAFGPDHPNVARDVNNLGEVFRQMGDLPAARANYERALAIDEKAFGSDHPNVARDVNNLGEVFRQMGDLPAARVALERALAIDEKTFGPDHPDVARDVNNLAGVYYALGDLPAARANYERALAIDEKAFGSDHPNVAIRVNNLGLVHQALGDLPAARAALERALRIMEKYAPNNPTSKVVRENLARVVREMENTDG